MKYEKNEKDIKHYFPRNTFPHEVTVDIPRSPEGIDALEKKLELYLHDAFGPKHERWRFRREYTIDRSGTYTRSKIVWVIRFREEEDAAIFKLSWPVL